ncbi:unnamed protein product [Clonostachys rosea f. rosea IK726]|jgi:regulator of RNase E activity RraA|uniref:Demethylmenaquinone methyltransferase n=2 Tax=Bionectria ochroleuca TaxID=29856 RepID=A0A0B7JNA1_BIOOC|nr:unnamed protein product [Clonostachys rosea f. rosea IK726]
MVQLDTLDRLSTLDTNAVADALDLLGIKGAVYGLRPLWNCPNIAGRVSTVKFQIKADATPIVPPDTTALSETTTDGHVLVISGGIDGVSCSEFVVNSAWKSNRIRGAVIDGLYQAVDDVHEDRCPAYGRGVASISDCSEMMQGDFGLPLKIRDVIVHQDDYVTADSSGTVFVPAKRIEEVLDVAERINHRRNLLAEAIEAGRPASDVMNDPELQVISRDGRSQAVAVSSNSNPKKSTPETHGLVSMLADVDTAAVSDALDKLGICGQALGIMPLENYQKVTVGPAFTVRYVPVGQPAGSVGDFIDDVGEGDVVVIDNGGRTDCTVWGDIMTQYAGLRGIAGTVINGVCRDVNRAIGDQYPLFTAGHWMRTGKDRVEVGAVNEPVAIGAVRVNPGDIVVADANGVVFIPHHRAREVAEVAQLIEQSEAGIREMIVDGATLAKAREVFKYHQLQRTE